MPDLRSVSRELPDPPYPESTKANGYKLELDLDSLYVSDTWTLAAPDERPWLLMTLAEAWRSVPIASLPSDRDVIAARIGTTREFLDAHAKTLLRDWIQHADNRLYHAYLTSLVLGMLGKRDSARMRRQRRQKSNEESTPSVSDSHRASPSVADVRRRSPNVAAEQEQETGSRKIEPPHNPPLPKNSAETASAQASPPPSPPVGGELSVKTKNPDLIPEGVDPQAWRDFVQHRKDIRKPLTPIAITKAANVLRPLSPSEQRQSVDTSIVSRWTGVFPPKPHSGSQGVSAPRRLTREERIAEQGREFVRKAFANGGDVL